MVQLKTLILTHGDPEEIQRMITRLEKIGYTCTQFIVKDARQHPNCVYDFHAVMQRPINQT